MMKSCKNIQATLRQSESLYEYDLVIEFFHWAYYIFDMLTYRSQM